MLRYLPTCALALLISYPGLSWGDSTADTAPSPARQTELLDLVRQDCGSCHGLRLTGGLGTPLTPAALKGKPPEMLKNTILYGRNGTTMPPWNPFLTDAEAAWIVQMLQKGLP